MTPDELVARDNLPIYTLQCNGCGNPIAYSFEPVVQSKTYCYLCALNITDLGDVLELPNVPTTTSVFRASQHDMEVSCNLRQIIKRKLNSLDKHPQFEEPEDEPNPFLDNLGDSW